MLFRPDWRYLQVFSVLVLIVVGLVTAPTAPARSPRPDSAVGEHQSVKPRKRGYWIVTRIHGYEGLWRCYVPAKHSKRGPFRCYRIR